MGLLRNRSQGRGGKRSSRARFPRSDANGPSSNNPALTKHNLETQIARCRRELSRAGNDAATESLRAFLADLENRLRNLEIQ
jgi:hypothetical protein